MKRRVLVVPTASEKRDLEGFLSKALGLGSPAVRALIARGAVYRSGRRIRDATPPLRAEERIVVVLEESGRAEPAGFTARSPAILFEDEALLVLDKPAGLVAQPTPSGLEPSLAEWASAHLGFPAGLVHRLDRETSGVTVFGKSREVTAALAAQFREKKASKRYLAVTGPSLPPGGEIDLPLSRDPSRPGRFRASRAANGVPALTRFTRLHQDDQLALVALFPKTGRTHQLRAHLAAMGAPIAGDRRYGGAERLGKEPIDRCLLHAQGLVLRHPGSGKPACFEAELPADLRRWFERAGVPPPNGPW